MLDWTSVRDFLAVAEKGSFSAAARELRLSQPTLGRRIAALEEELGSDLFVRTPRGLHLTATGEAILEIAKAMREEAIALERTATGNDQTLAGTVRLTAPEAFGMEWLVEHLTRFHQRYPKIQIELIVDNSITDISRREADIALRVGEPRQPDLIARQLCPVRFAFYASRDYVTAHGAPETPKDLKRHKLVLPDDRLLEIIRQTWPDVLKFKQYASFQTNNAMATATAISCGFGIGLQSALMAWRSGNIVRMLPDLEYPPPNIWVVTHAELRRSARIRAAFSFLRDLVLENRRLFEELPSGDETVSA